MAKESSITESTKTTCIPYPHTYKERSGKHNKIGSSGLKKDQRDINSLKTVKKLPLSIGKNYHFYVKHPNPNSNSDLHYEGKVIEIHDFLVEIFDARMKEPIIISLHEVRSIKPAGEIGE